MFVGFPEGAPLRRAATFTYNHVQAVRFLRTSYKAGPLVSLGLAGLGALAVHALRPRLRAVALVGAAVLVALACWPLARGAGLDRQLGLAHGVPAAWRDAAHDLDRTLPRGRRAMVLPGQLFAFYDWGGTYDPILPALTDRPVATRFIVPFADLRAVDLQWTTDALVSQQRALPGQLRPLLDLMGVGAVCRAPTTTAHAAARSRPRRRPESSTRWARRARLRAAAHGARARRGRSSPPRGCRRSAAGACRPAGMVRVLPRDGATVVDGSAAAIADLAAFGALRTDRALHYAADLTSRRCAPRRRAGPRSSSATPTAGASSSPRGCAATRAGPCPPPRSSPRTRRSWTRSRAAAPTRRPSRSWAAAWPRSAPTSRPASPSSPSAARSPRSTATRRPRGWPTARWPPIATTSISASRRRATSTTSTSCPTATARGASIAWP